MALNSRYIIHVGLQENLRGFWNDYRFGFNGQEKVNEIAGTGNHNTAKFWEYDTRLGRRWNIDPVVKQWESGYSCFSNNPIIMSDILGNNSNINITKDKDKKLNATISATIYIVPDPNADKDGSKANKLAKQLNEQAKKVYKPKEVNGVKISFKLNYIVKSNANPQELKNGQNILRIKEKDFLTQTKEIDEETGEEITSTVTGVVPVNQEGAPFKNNVTSNEGDVINDVGTVLHETGHLIGLSETYNEVTGKVLDERYKNNVMNNTGSRSELHIDQYSIIATNIKQINSLGLGTNLISNKFIDHHYKLITTPSSSSGSGNYKVALKSSNQAFYPPAKPSR
jgi:hypothetical protein